MRERGHAIPQIGEWWCRLARSMVANDPRDLRTLGVELARKIGKRKPFTHSSLSRFANRAIDPKTKHAYPVTYEMIQALCAEFTRLPPPIVFPRSYEEAAAISAIVERYDRIPAAEEGDAAVVPLPKPDDRRRRGSSKAASPAPLSAHGRRRARG